jgi:hypothetical protein
MAGSIPQDVLGINRDDYDSNLDYLAAVWSYLDQQEYQAEGDGDGEGDGESWD